MSGADTKQKSRREVAKAFVEKWSIFASPVDAVELLLRCRDERAAKIADYYSEEDGDIASQAAAAIRNEDANA